MVAEYNNRSPSSNLFAVVDRAYVIGEHTIIAEGKPKDILKSTKARELYFGSFDN